MNTVINKVRMVKVAALFALIGISAFGVTPISSVPFPRPDTGSNVTETVDSDVTGGTIAVINRTTGCKYENLVDAMAAVAAGATNTLQLQSNFSGAGIFLVANAGKDITIDLNGKTYTCIAPAVGSTGTENQAFHLEKGNTVAIMNGTIAVAESAKEDFRFVIQNYCDLTLTSVTLDGGNLAKPGKVCYTLSNNSGAVKIGGSTSITTPVGGFAMDACKYLSYAVPTVTLNTTGTIGAIELSGGAFVYEAGRIGTVTTTAGYADGDAPAFEARIGNVLYLTFGDALAKAVDGTVTLLKAVTLDEFAPAVATVIDLNGTNLTLNAATLAKDLTITDGADTKGKLVVTGAVSVEADATLDLSGIAYGETGLVRGQSGTLSVAAGGNVVVPSMFAGAPANYLAPNVGTGFATLASGAKVTLGTTTNTWDGTLLTTGNEVANATIAYGGKTFTQGYGTNDIQSAVDKTVDGTVTVLKDFELAKQLEIYKPITFDLATHKVTFTNPESTRDFRVRVIAGSDTTPGLTLLNGTVDGRTTPIIYMAGGTLALTNCTMLADVDAIYCQAYDGKYAITIDKDSVVEMNDTDSSRIGCFFLNNGSQTTYPGVLDVYGKIVTRNAPAIESYRTKGDVFNIHEGAEIITYGSVAIWVASESQVNVCGGTVMGVCGIAVQSGELNISGGEVAGLAGGVAPCGDEATRSGAIDFDGSAIFVDSNTGNAGKISINITGGTVTSAYHYAINEIGMAGYTSVTNIAISGDARISGGKYETVNGECFSIRPITEDAVSISGGRFTSKPKATWRAEGCSVFKTDDETYPWTIRKGGLLLRLTTARSR